MAALVAVAVVVDVNAIHFVVGQASSLPCFQAGWKPAPRPDKNLNALSDIMRFPSPSQFSFLIWVVLALVLLLGVTGDLSAATVVGTGPGLFATSATRTRVIQVAAVGMALALFIIMRSCKH